MSSAVPVSRSVRFLRTSAIRDLQRSDEWSRLVFCFLFALVAVLVSFVLMAPGAGRLAAWLFALALLVDCVSGIVLMAGRLKEPATSSMMEFIALEHRHTETRLRFERLSRGMVLALGAAALLLIALGPKPPDSRVGAFDVLGRMAVATAFLAFAWRRAKMRSSDVRRELEHYLEDLKTEVRS